MEIIFRIGREGYIKKGFLVIGIVSINSKEERKWSRLKIDCKKSHSILRKKL